MGFLFKNPTKQKKEVGNLKKAKQKSHWEKRNTACPLLTEKNHAPFVDCDKNNVFNM